MTGKAKGFLFAFSAISFFSLFVVAADPNQGVEIVRYTDENSGNSEYSIAHLAPASIGDRKGIAVVFKGTSDLHFYANPKTAPGGYNLKINAASPNIQFGDAEFGKWSIFHDKGLGIDVEVFVGDFTAFIPILSMTPPQDSNGFPVKVTVSGLACTSRLCLPPFEKPLPVTIHNINISWPPIELNTNEPVSTAKGAAAVGGYSLWFALALAFVAGLSLNIMPCVWPVLPIIVMRIVAQAKDDKGRSVVMGLAFCLGILLFFASLAAANIVLQLFYGTVLQWGDQLRNPAIVTAMSILLVVVALFMFGIFGVALPSSLTGAGSNASRGGFAGSLGMGFLAAILSTPCSFGILAAAFAWAQAQNLTLGTLAIMTIGIGMAVPYAILTSMPALLNKLPRAGRWMELFKQTVGFILLAIAIKLIAALPAGRVAGVLYFCIVLAFALWMWGSWVGFGTPAGKKWFIRTIAVLLTVAAGWIFLSAPAAQLIDWKNYDAQVIEKARAENKPVLIKFTADWCLSCLVAEKTVFSRKDIAELIKEKGVLTIKADTTEADFSATTDLKNIYKEPGVPVTILYLPNGNEQRWRGMAFGDDLKKYLQGID